ncbi:MAG TPA: TadE family protein [Terriglobia bacterium]|nr:TadE family protein [Terriglobia bacterium]
MQKTIFRTKTRSSLERRLNLRELADRLRGSISRLPLAISTRLKETEGAELLEFALALPMILVMVAGLLDFARAYNIKQKLANAVREGARYQSNETGDLNSSTPSTVPTLRDEVVTYLTNAGGINTSFIGTTLSYTGPPTCTGTWYTTRGGVNYGLMVERCVKVPDTANSTTILSTRVTLYYPYDWTFGFDHIMKLMLPSSNFTSPIRIQTDATMSNP